MEDEIIWAVTYNETSEQFEERIVQLVESRLSAKAKEVSASPSVESIGQELP